MESKVIKISIDHYKKLNNIIHDEFDESYNFDAECGLSYGDDESNQITGYFYFRVVDEHKYFLAKIKYGI